MTYRQTLHIEAPVDKVFGYLADPAKYASARPGDVVFEGVHVTPEGVGTHYRWSSRMAGVTIQGFDVFTEYVPDRRITDRSSSALEGTWTYSFAPEGTGTRLTVENHVRSLWRLPGLHHLLDRMTARTHAPVFARLKALLEQ